MVQNKVSNFIAVALAACSATSAFTTPPSTSKAFQANHSKLYMSNSEGDKNGGFFGAVGNFFEELDAFVDDATNRRLGGGAAFYGKRKSGFYGKEDSGRKKDKNASDPTEDYQGPKTAGYFQWMPDENGQMRPVTRLKNQNIERNPKYWDKAFNDED